MPRPCKRRRICAMPKHVRFVPSDQTPGEHPVIAMTLDEYESIRLIDLEGLTQEACAERMAVSRTTVQTIYNSARRKLAECLIHGKELHITGGDYELCSGDAKGCGYGRCHRRRCLNKISSEENPS